MANIDGLPVNSAVTHAEFMSRTQDTSTVSKISLLDPDVASGDSISNVQKAINKSFEGVGAIDENDSTINDYPSTNYIDNGDDRKVAVAKLDDQLFMTQTQLDDLDILNSQDVALGAIGSTPNANGATLSGQNLNLEPANASFGGVVTTGAQTFAGDKTFQNNVVVTGDLTVNGTTTTVNSTTVSTADKNITISQGGNDAASEGAGLTVDRTSADGSLIYKDASDTKWAAGALGSEVDLVGTTSTQALTNKTISGSSNTITNVSLTTGVTGTLPIANGGTGQTAQTAAFDALSPLTTKGDLIVNNGTNDIRLAVGTNNYVLTADSAEASGVKWAANTNVARYARYYLSASQSISDATNTTVIWNVEQVNTIQAGMMNTGTGRLTLGRAGVLRCSASFGIVNSISIVSGHRTALYLRKNGGSLLKIAGDTFEGSVTETKQSQGSDLLFFDNATDYYDVVCYLDFGGGPYNLGSVNTGVTFLSLDEL